LEQTAFKPITNKREVYQVVKSAKKIKQRMGQEVPKCGFVSESEQGTM
jgi:hypothetical protein